MWKFQTKEVRQVAERVSIYTPKTSTPVELYFVFLLTQQLVQNRPFHFCGGFVERMFLFLVPFLIFNHQSCLIHLTEVSWCEKSMDRLDTINSYFNQKERARLNELVQNTGGLPTMSKEEIRLSCVENDGYESAELNEKLYLHFRGFKRIENLEEYTSCKVNCNYLNLNPD